MRALFGLVGLLVAVFVLMYVWVQYNAPVLKTGRQAQTEVAGIGLQTTEGERYQDMVKLDEVPNRDGKTVALAVRSIKADSEFQRRSGLRAGDEIIEVGNQGGLTPVRDILDGEIAMNDVIATPRGKWPLKVRRDGKVITLQSGAVTTSAEDAATQAPAVAATPTTQPAAVVAAGAQTPATPPAPEQPAATADPSGQSTDSNSAPKPPAPQPQRQQKGRGIYGQVEDIRDKLENR